MEEKKECKVINLQEWIKNKALEKRKKIYQAILERGNELDKKPDPDYLPPAA